MARDSVVTFDILARDRASQAFESAGKSAEGFGTKLKDVATKVAAIAATAGAAVGVALAKGFADALDAEKMSDKLAAQLGLNAEESARAGKVAGDLYADAYGDSLGQVNEAIGAVGSSLVDMADVSTARLEGLTATALDLVAAFEIDVARAVGSASVLFESGLAKSAEHAFDVITVGLQNVPTQFREDLLDASDEYAPFFKDLGLSAEEAFGLLVNGSKLGMYGIDKTGDALKEFGIRATDMSKATLTAFAETGLNANEMADALVAGGPRAREAFGKTVKAILEIEDPVTRANTAIALFGTPLEDLGVSKIPAFLSSLVNIPQEFSNVEGAAERMGDTLNDNLGTKIESFKRTALVGLQRFVEEKLIPAFERTGAIINERIRPAFEEWWAGFNEKYMPVIRDLVDLFQTVFFPTVERLWEIFKTKVVPAFQEAWAAIEEKLEPAIRDVEKAYRDNQPEIEKVVNFLLKLWGAIYEKVLPVLGTFVAFLVSQVFTRLATMIDWIGKVVRAIETMAGWFDTAREKLTDLNEALENSPWGKLSGGVKDLLGFAEGGVVPGPLGAPVPAIVHGGETIIPPSGFLSSAGEISLTINNPTPEPASTTVQRELRMITQFMSVG